MPPSFSARTAWNLGEGDLARAIREARAAGKSLVDLTVSNPTVCGFEVDAREVLEPLGDPMSLVYDPDPRGILSAREAVARYYADHAATVDPGQIVLTTSTSEAYSFLFRLLCDPGDALLVAQPGYPLFDFLSVLDNVALQPYPLFHDFGWWIDFAELERAVTPRTRALLLVHPNNPTGHATSRDERERLEEFCARHNLALIVDEVFLDYSLTDSIESFAAGAHACLTFVVSGLSKIAALPQMKAGWIAAFGPAAVRREALNRLEVIADTFLSMNAPVQHALPVWLAGRAGMQQQILARVRANLAMLDAALPILPVGAGWAAILRLPQRRGQDHVNELVAEAGVIVHPGSFYGMAGDHFAVVSLIVPQEIFESGIAAMVKHFLTLAS